MAGQRWGRPPRPSFSSECEGTLQATSSRSAPDGGRRERRIRPWVGLLGAAAPGALALAVALLGPLVAPHSQGDIVGPPFVGPGAGVPLGTDYLGHDLLSRVLLGGRSLVLLPLVATAAASGIGTVLGILSGYLRGRFDRALLQVVDVALALPWILVLLVLVSGWGSGPAVLVAAAVLTGSPFVARVARAATLRVAQTGYVEQALALGEPIPAIVAHEILPNMAGPLLADAGLRLVVSLYLVATASFLGYGPQPPAADWGLMINENAKGLSLTPWGVAVPAVLIACLAVSINLLVDRLAKRLAR